MKKNIFVFLLFMPFIALSNFAQEKIEHLKFMGIPIDGKISKFKKNLEKKGLQHYTTLNNHYIFRGSFAGDDANIFVMYDTKTKVVSGVGVSIQCLSHQIAKDKYNNYVNDFKDKYETDKWNEIIKYYHENLDTLSEHIANGTFKKYNSSFTDSIDTEFTIELSKILLDDKDKLLASIDNSFWGLKLFFESGNIGTIKVIYKDDGDNTLSILYMDKQNTSLIKKKRKDDL